MIERLKILQANKKQFANGSELFNACKTDSTLRNEIEVLAKHYLSKSVSGCSNCYSDAYFELINLKIEKAMAKDTCNFKLRTGALLHDAVNFDNDLLCSNANISDELALYHLKTNPNCRKFFEKVPENVDELIEAYKLPGEEPELTDAEKELVKELVIELKAGATKTALREKYEKTTVGTKKITQKVMTEFLKLAESEVNPED